MQKIKVYNVDFYCDKKPQKSSDPCGNSFVVQYRIEGEPKIKKNTDHVPCPKCNGRVSQEVSFK